MPQVLFSLFCINLRVFFRNFADTLPFICDSVVIIQQVVVQDIKPCTVAKLAEKCITLTGLLQIRN